MADVICSLALSVMHRKVKIPQLGCSLLLTSLLLLLPPRLDELLKQVQHPVVEHFVSRAFASEAQRLLHAPSVIMK